MIVCNFWSKITTEIAFHYLHLIFIADHTGDEIVEVNGIPMADQSHEEALKIFKSAKKRFLTLVVRPYKDSAQVFRTSSMLQCMSPVTQCFSTIREHALDDVIADGNKVMIQIQSVL